MRRNKRSIVKRSEPDLERVRRDCFNGRRIEETGLVFVSRRVIDRSHMAGSSLMRAARALKEAYDNREECNKGRQPGMRVTVEALSEYARENSSPRPRTISHLQDRIRGHSSDMFFLDDMAFVDPESVQRMERDWAKRERARRELERKKQENELNGMWNEAHEDHQTA